jgi:uncharacterized protein YcfL
MKKLVSLVLATTLMVGCASQQKSNCGSKAQKKAKYNSMKSGKSPGGGMLR